MFTINIIELRGYYYKDSVSELRQMFGESVHESQIGLMRDEHKERDAGTSYETGDIMD
ncbi:hypothetical protein [Sporosarcina aquimarina]|uniref:hypothetical protein n=1 Tax=Sporosarcina aquimarina TaxID=114975 RepID=UPI001C8D8276|nr:hypothetical protein [Sporosarcina aquimarina]MBY0221592.1 hypothetical protein [Sporosarcina aquimarina]